MKPYGLGPKLRFPSKRDCHPPKGWINWWEDEMQHIYSRKTLKQRIKREIDERYNEEHN